jgi:hypothetical protein
LQPATALKRPFNPEIYLLQPGGAMFEQVIMRAQFQCVESAAEVIGIDEDKNGGQFITGLRGLQNLDAILFGETKVGENDLEEVLFELLSCLKAIAGLGHVMSLLAKNIGESLP